jgi:ribosomal protein S18 acetylase RimI-like enzyme
MRLSSPPADSAALTDPIEIRLLTAQDASVLSNMAEGVFDGPIDPSWCAEFFADARHHLVVALDGSCVIGMASGVHYLHPDRPHELYVNEVGVSDSYRNQGIGRLLVGALLTQATTLGCETAWVLTHASNAAARRMYAAAGGVEDRDAPVMIEFRL